jgi:hypothetical protein
LRTALPPSVSRAASARTERIRRRGS